MKDIKLRMMINLYTTSCLKCKTFVKIRRWLITTRVEDDSFNVKKNSCNAST